jgi:tocopherol cyclase
MLARGAASGWVDWGGRRYEFTNAPVYAEKNWGAGFPKKWFWVQAAGFEGEPDAALTSVGGHSAVLITLTQYPLVSCICLDWESHALAPKPWLAWLVSVHCTNLVALHAC